MEEIFEQFKDKDAFDAYWKEHYVPLTYEDVREAYEDFVKSADKHIFLSDYEKSGNVSREDFMDNLSQAAQMEGGDANIAAAFHEEYQRLYHDFLLELFDTQYAE